MGFLSTANSWAQKNPGSAALITTGGAIVLGTGGAMVALPLIGFTSAGVAAGSVAALWRSTIGNVTAGSLFALCESAGAGGAAATAMTAIGATGGDIAGIGLATGLAGSGGENDKRVRDTASGSQSRTRKGGSDDGKGSKSR